MKLIEKDAVLAEIEELKTAIDIKLRSSKDSAYWKAQILICERLEFKINSLEAKEVDLDIEIERVRKHHFVNDDFDKVEIDGRTITNIAKHFFKLGMAVSNKSQKGEKIC